MNLRSNLLLFLALATGTALAFGTKMILTAIPENRQEEILRELRVPAMVAKKDLVLGEEITPQNIRFDRFSESEVPTDVITHYKDAAGRTLFHDVKKGEMISLYHLNAPNDNGIETGTFIPLKNHFITFLIESIIDEGNLLTDDVMINRVRKNIRPQTDKVDFLLSYEKGDAKDAETGKPLPRTLSTETLLDHVDVYQVKLLQKVIDNEGTIKSALKLAFILSDEQLRLINEASAKGKITIVVQDPNAVESESQPMILQGTTREESPSSTEDEKEDARPIPDRKNGDGKDGSSQTIDAFNESAFAKASPLDLINTRSTSSVSSIKTPLSRKGVMLLGDREEGPPDETQSVNVAQNNGYHQRSDAAPPFFVNASDANDALDDPVGLNEADDPDGPSFKSPKMTVPRKGDDYGHLVSAESVDSESARKAKLFRTPRMSVPRTHIVESDSPAETQSDP